MTIKISARLVQGMESSLKLFKKVHYLNEFVVNLGIWTKCLWDLITATLMETALILQQRKNTNWKKLASQVRLIEVVIAQTLPVRLLNTKRTVGSEVG